MKLTRKVKQILSWYEADNPGTKANLARMMMHGKLAGTGKLVIRQRLRLECLCQRLHLISREWHERHFCQQVIAAEAVEQGRQRMVVGDLTGAHRADEQERRTFRRAQ